MAKSNFDVQAFIKSNSDLGEVQKQGGSVAFIKTQNWGKIEFNHKSGRIIVGSGTSAKMHEAIVQAIFDKLNLQLSKRNKSYTVFEGSPADFRRVFGAATSVAPMAKTVKATTKKVKPAKVDANRLTVEAAAAKIQAIKAKNMEAIKAVAAKRAAKLVG